MNTKNVTRQAAIRKSQIKSTLIIMACVLFILVVVISLIVDALRQDSNRVFSGVGTSVTLYEDGTFNAFLPHNVRRSGTYTENITDGVTEVLFMQNGETEIGRIHANVLTLPTAWEPECVCWHNLRLRLR